MEGAWVFVVAALAALAACAHGKVELPEEMAEMAQMVRDQCVEDSGVAVALLAAVDGGAALSPDPQLKCYTKCVMETAGMLSDGEVDIDMVLELLPDELSARNGAALRACGTQRGADDCDTAYLTQVCWQNSNKDDYFLI